MGKPEKITECPHQSVNTKQLCYRCIDINDTIDEYEAYLSQKQGVSEEDIRADELSRLPFNADEDSDNDLNYSLYRDYLQKRIKELAEMKKSQTLAVDKEQEIREYLWMNYPVEYKYGDDGEMQCAGIDFKRTPLLELIKLCAVDKEVLDKNPIKEFLSDYGKKNGFTLLCAWSERLSEEICSRFKPPKADNAELRECLRDILQSPMYVVGEPAEDRVLQAHIMQSKIRRAEQALESEVSDE